MSVSSNVILFASICTVAGLGTFVYANATNNSSDSYFAEDAALPGVVPWPGIAWLDRMASPDNSFSFNGSQYRSAYEAILNTGSGIHPTKNFNAYVNSFIIPHGLSVEIVKMFGTSWAHYVISYLRNLLAGTTMYYTVSSLFHYHCYIHQRSKEIFKDRKRPSNEIIFEQIKLAQSSLLIYSMLPTLSEYIIEEGYSLSYYTIDEIGGFVPYIAYTLLYFALVEIGIYWMHRTLHTNKFLYKHIHMPHHKYSKPDTLTPWASIAFHPIDGMLQACPYILCLPVVPCHYLTHTAMIFFTEIWATYIHDTMDWNIDPIMGSKYHTVHHTHYIYNYGQIFTFCDRIWGTLRVPVGKTGVLEGPQKVKLLPAKKGLFGKGRGMKVA